MQNAYAIGVAYPVSTIVEAFDTSKHSNTELENFIRNNFDLCPQAIIKDLDLKKSIYRKLASYGHTGKEDFIAKWEGMFNTVIPHYFFDPQSVVSRCSLVVYLIRECTECFS